MQVSRQWPEVYDLCNTFLHVVRVKSASQKLAQRAQTCNKIWLLGPLPTGLYMVSKITLHLLPIWLQACNRFRFMAISCQTLFPSFCALPSEAAVWLESEQAPICWTSRRSRSAALHGIRIRTGCFVHTLFWLRDQWMMERSSKAMKAVSVGNQFSQFRRKLHRKFHVTWGKNLLSLPEIFKSFKLSQVLTLELSRKSGSIFSSSEQVSARIVCRRLEYTLCLCPPAQVVPERGPKRSVALILHSKPSIVCWNSVLERLPGSGSNLDSNYTFTAWFLWLNLRFRVYV